MKESLQLGFGKEKINSPQRGDERNVLVYKVWMITRMAFLGLGTLIGIIAVFVNLLSGKGISWSNFVGSGILGVLLYVDVKEYSMFYAIEKNKLYQGIVEQFQKAQNKWIHKLRKYYGKSGAPSGGDTFYYISGKGSLAGQALESATFTMALAPAYMRLVYRYRIWKIGGKIKAFDYAIQKAGYGDLAATFAKR